MEIIELTLNQYEQFLKDSNMAYNFMQSSEFLKSQSHNDEILVLAGEEDGKILYAVPVILRPAMKMFRYASSPREWVASSAELMKDEALLDEFTKKVSDALSDKKAIAWFVESNVEYAQHDKNGNVIEDGFNNEGYREMLSRIGFIPMPLWTGYDTARQSRWVSWIDLQKNLPEASRGYPIPLENGLEEYTWPELLKEMAGNTRRSFQKTDLPYIECDLKRGDEDFSLDDFNALLEASAEKHSFESGNPEHRQILMESFGDKGYVCTSYLNTDAYKNYLEETRKTLLEKEAAAKEVCEKMPNSKKKRNQLLEIQDAIAHNEKESSQLSELMEKEDQSRIALASGIFLETPSEMVYLYGGSRPDLARYMGPYANQKKMIHLALDHKLQRYNFWGISGNFKPEEEGYGVYFFKKNLGATVGEYCGEFVRSLHPVFGKMFLKKCGRI